MDGMSYGSEEAAMQAYLRELADNLGATGWTLDDMRGLKPSEVLESPLFEEDRVYPALERLRDQFPRFDFSFVRDRRIQNRLSLITIGGLARLIEQTPRSQEK